MPDPLDAYCDQFQVNLGPYGATLNFSLTGATPPAPGSAPQSERVASLRMSIEHLKVLTFIVHRQVKIYESKMAVSVPVPVEVLNSLSIGVEDWESFWRQ